MGRYDRDVRLNDQSGDPITPGNPLPTTSGGGGGGGGTSQADKSTFTEGTTQMTPVGGVYNESLGADPSEDQAAAVRITAKRALHINVRSAAGVEIGTAAAPLRTDPTGTTAQPVTDNGGSLTVDDGGGSITVDGTVAATQSGSWTVTANAGTGIFSVATEVQSDFDTDGGTQSLSLIGLALPASGGAVVGGTATDPLRTDPTGTTAQPVTDNGGSLTVDDGGGSLTVDGTVAATQSGTWSVQLTDGSLIASVRNTGSNDSLNVAIVDGSGNQITSFGGGTQYTDGDTDSTPTGTVGMWWDDGDDTVHATSPSNPLPVDIQNTPIPVTDNGGSLTVDGTVAVSGTVTVAGTVTANQGGSWTVTADAGTGTFTVDQLDTASLDYDSDGGTVNQTVIGIALPGAGGPVAGGTSANPVRVDPTGTTAQPITDNGGSLTVDGTVAATQSGTWAVQITDGSLTASIRNTGSNDSLNVAIVDGSGNQIVSFGGGTQYTDGDTDATPTGTVAMWWDDGDDTVHATSPSDPLPVTVVSGGGGGMVDDSPFTPGSSTVVPMGAYVDDTGTDSVDEGDIGAPRMSATRLLYVTTFSGSPVAISDGGGTITVDGSVSVSGTVGVTQSTSPWVVGDGGGSLTVDGPLTDTELRATAVVVDASGTAVPVTDNGGSLTVDGTVAATQSGTWSVQLTDGSLTASVRNTGSNDSLNVAIVDASGNQIVSFGSSPSDLVVTDTLTGLNDTITIDCEGYNSIGGWLDPASPTDVWFLDWEGTVDGVTWDNVYGYDYSTSTGIWSSAIFQNGGGPPSNRFVIPCAGLKQFRLKVTFWSSGTVAATLRATQGVVHPDPNNLAIVGVSGTVDVSAVNDVTEETGTLTALNDDVTVQLQGQSSCCITFENSAFFAGLVLVEATGNGNDWVDLTTITTQGELVEGEFSPSDSRVLRAIIGSFEAIRVRCTFGFAGSVDVTIRASVGDGPQTELLPSLPVVVANQVINVTSVGGGAASEGAGRTTILATITGTWTGTVEFRDGSAGPLWPMLRTSDGANPPIVTSTTSNGTFLGNGATQNWVWFMPSVLTGTAVVTVTFIDGPQVFSLVRSIPAGINNIGDVDVLSVIPGTGATNLGKAEDGTPGNGDTGVALLGIRQNTPAASGATDAKYAIPYLDRLGQIRVNPRPDRLVSGHYAVSTFRTLGNTATPQNLFTIENANGSSVLLALQKLEVSCTYTAVLIAVEPEAILSRSAALPTGGTALTHGLIDTTETANASITCRGATASDGGGATAITATAGTFLQRQFLGRIHTAVGEVNSRVSADLLVGIADRKPFLLRANQAMLVQIVAAAAASNLATNHYTVNAEFEVFTLP